MLTNLPYFFHKRGIYYGYIVLFAGTIGLMASLPGQTMGISVYTEHLIQALGIDRLALSLMYLLGTLSSALLLPSAGRLLDKLGARFMSVIAGCGLALFLMLLANSDKTAHFIANTFKVQESYAALIMLYFCFFGIRHFGQGQLTMASRTMMGRWFEKKRGLMLGISGTFVAFSFGATPVILNKLINHFNWRGSLQALAVALIFFSIFAYVFFRRAPEHHGLKVDGGILDHKQEKANIPNTGLDFTVKKAKKTFTFWVFNLGTSVQALLMTAITFHIADIGFESGLNTAKSFSVFIPLSFISVFAELSAGYFSDKIPLKFILAIMQAGLGLSLIGLQSFGTNTGFMMVAVGLGISSGIFSLLTSAAWPKLFGRLHLGAIMGLVTAWMVGASSVGPYLFSQGKAFSGNYSLIIYGVLLIPISIFCASFFTNNPMKVGIKTSFNPPSS